MNVIGYGRVSSVGQEEGDGYARQESAIKAFCEKNGLELQGITFEAVSGTVDGMDRPQLRERLQCHEAHRGSFDAIVVERMDRLARDLMVQELLIREFQKRGIKLFSADQGEPVDLAEHSPDPTRKLIRQVLGAVAEFEKTSLVLKLRAARVRKGNLGGNVNYGTRPGEAEILRAMRAFRSDGLSLRQIAVELNEYGALQRNGKPWSHSAVSNILNSYPGGDK